MSTDIPSGSLPSNCYTYNNLDKHFSLRMYLDEVIARKTVSGSTLIEEDYDLFFQLLLWVFHNAEKVISKDEEFSQEVSSRMQNFKQNLQDSVDFSEFDQSNRNMLVKSKVIYRLLVPSKYSKPMLDELLNEASDMPKESWFLFVIGDEICFNSNSFV